MKNIIELEGIVLYLTKKLAERRLEYPGEPLGFELMMAWYPDEEEVAWFRSRQCSVRGKWPDLVWVGMGEVGRHPKCFDRIRRTEEQPETPKPTEAEALAEIFKLLCDAKEMSDTRAGAQKMFLALELTRRMGWVMEVTLADLGCDESVSCSVDVVRGRMEDALIVMLRLVALAVFVCFVLIFVWCFW